MAKAYYQGEVFDGLDPGERLEKTPNTTTALSATAAGTACGW